MSTKAEEQTSEHHEEVPAHVDAEGDMGAPPPPTNDAAAQETDGKETEEEVIPTEFPTFPPDTKESDLNLPKDCFLLSKQNDGFQIPYYLTSEEEVSKVRPPAVVKTWEQRIGECDEKQQATFHEFVEEVKKQPWYEEKFDDWYCLRYLIARSFDIKKALKMLEKTAQWIKDFGYDEKTQCSICQKDPNQHMGQFIGWDKEHRPVMFMSMRWGPERKNPLEHMVCCFKHLISQMPQGVEKWVCVTDFESYSHFKDGKPSMGLGVINTIQDHFPERLGKMICVNPPTLFWVLWKAFYNFIDPVTRTKVEFVYTEDKPCIYESFPKLFPYHIRGFMYDTYNRSKHKLPAEPLVWVPDPDGYPTTHDERKEQLKANKAREKDDKKAVKEAEKEKKDAAKEASDHHKKKESKGKSSKGKDKEKKDGEEAASAPEEAASAHTQTASNKESQKE